VLAGMISFTQPELLQATENEEERQPVRVQF
jgi:hypothetical protein